VSVERLGRAAVGAQGMRRFKARFDPDREA
jgi:hypothetical protein